MNSVEWSRKFVEMWDIWSGEGFRFDPEKSTLDRALVYAVEDVFMPLVEVLSKLEKDPLDAAAWEAARSLLS